MNKNIARKIHKILRKAYGTPRIELNYNSDFELLIAVILSAQTTDKKVNSVTPMLFSRFPSPEKLSKAKQKHVEEIIKEIGLFRSKAKNIIAAAKIIMNEFNSQIPDTYEGLIKLPGVGRKSANVILSTLFNKPAITVDTHVKRLSYRIGFSDNKDPYKIELDLMEKWSEELWNDLSRYIILHGRYVCKARTPQCNRCPINKHCQKRIK